MLTVILAFNNVDGLALGLVLQSIKVDLALSDTQLGLLSGIAFALFYSLMGIPLARWADRGNRVKIISVTIIIWSVMVALCGTARTFVQLLVMRVGVAVGESGCIPPAHSLIADHFDRIERPRAVSIYMLGPCLSTVIGYFVAGWFNERYGWRAMFTMLGLPGILLSLLAWFTLHEPRQQRAPGGSVATSSVTSVAEVCITLFRKRTFCHVVLSFSLMSFFGYGVLQWQPAFFIRSYGLGTGELGRWFAVIYGVCGVLGTFAGGAVATRFAARNEALQLRAIAVAYCGFAFASALIYLAPNYQAAFAMMALGALGLAGASGPLFATIQSIVPAPMRATSIAIVYFFANLIGLGLGPLAAGALSDALRPLAGEESLRYALLLLCPGYLWGAWHVFRASRTVVFDLPRTATAHATGMADHDDVVRCAPCDSHDTMRGDS